MNQCKYNLWCTGPLTNADDPDMEGELHMCSCTCAGVCNKDSNMTVWTPDRGFFNG